MMLIQSSIPNSVEDALSFVSNQPYLLCKSMPSTETWQKFPECDKLTQVGHGEVIPLAQGEKDDIGFPSSNIPRSSSQLSTISAISESSTPMCVYQRRKQKKYSVAVCPAQVSVNMKPNDCCLSAITSEAPTAVLEEPMVFLVGTEAVRSPGMLHAEFNGGALVSNSESFDGCSGGEPVAEEASRSGMAKVLEFSCGNDSCSSSKSNMDLVSASFKSDDNDTGECSSSGAFSIEGLQDDMSGRDICISILRSGGLLAGVWHERVCTSGSVITGGSRCSRPCKVCDLEEITTKMIICDNCEEAFHVSCCIPRMKMTPVDEWFCHSCLRKKHKILNEGNMKSLDLSSERRICRSTMQKGEIGPILSMLRYSEPYTSSVRIGNKFQAEISGWSGPLVDEIYPARDLLEMNASETISLRDSSCNKSSKLSSIGNWLQCQEVIEGVKEGIDGTICGKWRRAPLFEVQTDGWECFQSVLWDPVHADCAVPQELHTDEVLKQLKYLEMLRPQLDAKRRKLGNSKRVGSQGPAENFTSTCTL